MLNCRGEVITDFIATLNSLDRFQSAWNNHPLSTEGNRSPLQLYTAGSVGSALFSDPINAHTYGLDSDDAQGLGRDSDDNPSVIVPETSIPLSDRSMSVLAATINPLHQCTDYGVQLYYDCSSAVHQLMQQDNLIV